MRFFSALICGLLLVSGYAQEPQQQEVQSTIEAFFEGFHQQDSIRIKETVAPEVLLQTIVVDSAGNTQVRTTEFPSFLRSIASIPPTTKFEEIIKSFSIQIDGAMANAWTPYEFHINDAFHHCGVNSFQLVRYGDVWKIVYLIDTRRTQGCNPTK